MRGKYNPLSTIRINHRVEPDISQIAEGLFVGGEIDQCEWKSLSGMGITFCVNLQHERQDTFDGTPIDGYLWLPVRDGAAPTMEHLRVGVRFVDAGIRSGRKVLIHCKAGTGRSPVLCAAYLVTQGQSTDEALDLIRTKREPIVVNTCQLERLREFEREWRKRKRAH